MRKHTVKLVNNEHSVNTVICVRHCCERHNCFNQTQLHVRAYLATALWLRVHWLFSGCGAAERTGHPLGSCLPWVRQVWGMLLEDKGTDEGLQKFQDLAATLWMTTAAGLRLVGHAVQTVVHRLQHSCSVSTNYTRFRHNSSFSYYFQIY